MHILSFLQTSLAQKEQSLIQYVRYMRESQDSKNPEIAALYADLAKAEEKHITVIRDQIAKLSGQEDILNPFQDINQHYSQNSYH